MKTIPTTLALLVTTATAIALAIPAPATAAPDKKGKSTSDAAKEAPADDAKKPSRKPARPAPDSSAKAERPARPVMKTEARKEMRPFLGVATSPIAPVLRDHLDIPEGFGIQVDFVVEGSPAEKAGLKPKDLLTRLDEQMLTSPEHLSLLVRSMSKGDKVSLTFIRKGQESKAEATLGESEMAAQPVWPQVYGSQSGHGNKAPMFEWRLNGKEMPPIDGKEIEQEIRRYQDRIQEWMQKQQPQRFQPRPPMPGKPQAGKPDPAKPALPLPGKNEQKSSSSSSSSSRIFIAPGQGKAPGQKPPAISVRPGFPVSVFSGNSMIRIDNPEGEVSIQGKDGKHTIKIVNADGETVYEGEYDPEKGTEGLPGEARKQLEKMKLDDLKMLGLPKIETKTDGKSEIKIEIGNGSEKPKASRKGDKSDKGDLL